MGAEQSSSTVSSCEGPRESNDVLGGSIDPTSVKLNSAAPSAPRAPMPRLMRPETFEERLYRKFTTEPLVPIGCLTTAYFLGSGIKSFYNRDPKRSQTMMRLRVGSQFATILIFIGYAGWNSFTFEFAPGMAVPGEHSPANKKGEEKK